MSNKESLRSKFKKQTTPKQIMIIILLIDSFFMLISLIGAIVVAEAVIVLLFPILYSRYLLKNLNGARIYIYNIIRFVYLIFSVDIYFGSDVPPVGLPFIIYLLTSNILILFVLRTDKSDTQLTCRNCNKQLSNESTNFCSS